MQAMILDKVKRALQETLNLNSIDDINYDTKLKEDLGLDSMSSLTFLMALENNIEGFIVDPDTLDVEHLTSVRMIIQYIQSVLLNQTATLAA